MSDDKKRLLIDIVADPVCPWCFVGLNAFKAAKPTLEDHHDVITRYRPYQLNPHTPIEGVDREAYYRKKFPDPEFRASAREQMIAAAAQAGVEFDPSIPKHLPNTLNAHRVLRWAHFEGRHDALVTLLYDAFWRRGEDIGAPSVLADLADQAGLDRDLTRQKLDDGDDSDLVAGEADSFRQAGVTGVPTFIVDERVGFSGALPPPELAASILQAAQQR